MTEEKKSCAQCKFCLLEDVGYSNYTVENTLFFCLKDAHPEDGFDSWYREADKLAYAEKCQQFEPGIPIELDVEQEALDDLSYYDEEQLKLLAKHLGRGLK
jgi:hypothetical protein